MEFKPFSKVPRLSRDCVITEKIDGTNAGIHITYELPDVEHIEVAAPGELTFIVPSSRKRFISVDDDNFGFARWVNENKEELVQLGEGSHFGEWWGSGVNRGYGLEKGEKRFSLFNTHRWGGEGDTPPECCEVVPVIMEGIFNTGHIEWALTHLQKEGSFAAPGFMGPEGIMIYHKAANQIFKKTFEDDESGKATDSYCITIPEGDKGR